MKQGDFTQLAKFYINRPSYSEKLVKDILNIIKNSDSIRIAEIGAGTGKLTKILASLSSNECPIFIDAVEPNDAMRDEGKIYTNEYTNILWHKGSGEETNLKAQTYDLVVMASSFHWTDPLKSLPEFHRILKDEGYFCCMWNPRDLQKGSVFYQIEENIKSILPNLKRASSGTQNTKNWYEILALGGYFKDTIYLEMPYFEVFTQERYINAWKSVNDIQAQAGQKWEEIMDMIKNCVAPFESLEAKYLIKAYISKKDKLCKTFEREREREVCEKYDKLWDYTKHAKFYKYRPNYAKGAIELLCFLTKAKNVADIGAGTGNLSLMLLENGLKVDAVEPNDAMREIGIKRTEGMDISWKKANGEMTSLKDTHYDWVTFGSSFNVLDRQKALKEAHRLLKSGAFFTCMWNHRDLSDKIQEEASKIIKQFVPEYQTGIRREDQRPFLEQNRSLFDEIFFLEYDFYFHQNIENYILAWKSVKNPYWDLQTPHGVELFDKICEKMRENLPSEFDIKYTTRAWSARKVG